MRFNRFITLTLCVFTLGVFHFSTSVQASPTDETTTITLEDSVHFLAPDGSDLLVEPGTYSVEAAEEWIRLIPGKERHDALLLEAKKQTHDVPMEIPIALSIPGSTPEELNYHQIQLLLPDGTSLEALGTYDGIRPRGWGWAKKARRKAQAAARAAAARAKKAKARARAIALKAKREAERQAKIAAAKARQLALKAKQETERQAKILACKGTVTAVKTGKNVAGFMQQVVPSAKQRSNNSQKKFKNDRNFRDQLIRKITSNLQAHQQKVPELKKIARSMNNPKNRGKLDAIFSTGNFCSDSIATMDKKLIQMGFAPNFATVRKRGANDERFYMGYQISLGGGVGAGLQIGLMGVTDFRGNGGKYWFIGPQGVLNATVGVTAQVAFYPKVALESFKGWGAGVGISAGPPSKVVSGAVDVMFDEKVKEFQGFGFGPGVGVGLSPVDAAFSYTHSWKY